MIAWKNFVFICIFVCWNDLQIDVQIKILKAEWFFFIYFGILNVQGCQFFYSQYLQNLNFKILNFFKGRIFSLQKQKAAVSLGP